MTAAATSPLESYQEGRNSFLAAVLDVVSGLETSVLDFQHQHDGQARTAAAELSEVLRDKSRLEDLLGEQTQELEAARGHVCAAEKDAVTPDEQASVTAPFDAGHQDLERVIDELKEALAAEERISSGLRLRIAESEGNAERLVTVEGELRDAAEEHSRFVIETRETYEQRLAASVRASEAGIRGEAVRIIEAIAADNPALAEAADLFTVAFPVEVSAEGEQHQVQSPAADVTPEPAAEPERGPVMAPPALAADFFNAVPTLVVEADPNPAAQTLPQAPDAEDNAILDPHFFDNPAPVEDTADEDTTSKGYGLFGRKKENQNVKVRP